MSFAPEFTNNNLYRVGSRNTNAAGLNLTAFSKPVTQLFPKSGPIDIANSFPWKNNGSTHEVPAIYAVEKELDYGVWARNLARLFSGAANLKNGILPDIYQNIYASNDTGFIYNFPWLMNNGDTMRSVSNSWGQTAGIDDMVKSIAGNFVGKGSKIGNLLGTAAGAALGSIAAGVGFESVQEYKDTSAQTLNLTFPLYNTISLESAYDNYTFVQLFTFQNLKTRTSFMTFIPPKIYTLYSNGIGGLYWPVAYVSDFTINNIGTTRRLTDFSKYGSSIIIPEAYKISITFKELLPQSSNIFESTAGGNLVSVTNRENTNTTINQQNAAAINVNTGVNNLAGNTRVA